MDESVNSSIEHYRRAIAINEDDWQAHKGLGVAYIIRGKMDKNEALKAKAVEQLRLSLDIKPEQSNRKGLLKLIEVYSRNK